MDKQQFIREALCLPTSAIDYHMSQYLSEHFPNKAMIEGSEGLFNIEEFASSGQCTFEATARYNGGSDEEPGGNPTRTNG